VFILVSIVQFLMNAPTVFTEECFTNDAVMFGEDWSCPALLTAFRITLLRKMKEIFARNGKGQPRTKQSEVPECPLREKIGGVEIDTQPAEKQSMDTSGKEGVANEKTAEPTVEDFGGTTFPCKKGEINKPSPVCSEGSIDYNPWLTDLQNILDCEASQVVEAVEEMKARLEFLEKAETLRTGKTYQRRVKKASPKPTRVISDSGKVTFLTPEGLAQPSSVMNPRCNEAPFLPPRTHLRSKIPARRQKKPTSASTPTRMAEKGKQSSPTEEVKPADSNTLSSDSNPLSIPPSPAEDHVSPVVEAPAPISSCAPIISAREDWSPQEWRYKFNKLIDQAIESHCTVWMPKKRVEVNGCKIRIPETYDKKFPGLLPIEIPRCHTIVGSELWAWVYHCKLVKNPFPAPAPEHLWPEGWTVWAGFDGKLIHPFKEAMVLKRRKEFLKYSQMKSPHSQGRRQIGVLWNLPQLRVSGRPAVEPQTVISLQPL
jgi:hypothetical protein